MTEMMWTPRIDAEMVAQYAAQAGFSAEEARSDRMMTLATMLAYSERMRAVEINNDMSKYM